MQKQVERELYTKRHRIRQWPPLTYYHNSRGYYEMRCKSW